MRKYEAIERLWSPSQERYIEAGEVVELEDEGLELKLLRLRVIKVAEVKESAEPRIARMKNERGSANCANEERRSTKS